MRWLVRGDVDGFFGLALDNLVQLLLIDALCRIVLGMPPELLYGWLLQEGILREGRNGRIRWAHAHVFLVQCGDQVPPPYAAPDSEHTGDAAEATLFMDYLRKVSGGRAISLLGDAELLHMAAPPSSLVRTRSASISEDRSLMSHIWQLRPILLRINNLVFSHDGVQRAQERLSTTHSIQSNTNHTYGGLDHLVRAADHMLSKRPRVFWPRHLHLQVPHSVDRAPWVMPSGAVDVMLSTDTTRVRAYGDARGIKDARITERGAVRYALAPHRTYCATIAAATTPADSAGGMPWLKFTASRVKDVEEDAAGEWVFDHVELSEFHACNADAGCPAFPFQAALERHT